eukprot:jgi/Psemu1/55533/gm1.55533_g
MTTFTILYVSTSAIFTSAGSISTVNTINFDHTPAKKSYFHHVSNNGDFPVPPNGILPTRSSSAQLIPTDICLCKPTECTILLSQDFNSHRKPTPTRIKLSSATCPTVTMTQFDTTISFMYINPTKFPHFHWGHFVVYPLLKPIFHFCGNTGDLLQDNGNNS